MKVTTSTTSHDFDLEGTRRVLILARTLGDSSINVSQVAIDLNFQDRYLKVCFTAHELDMIRALKQSGMDTELLEPNTWDQYSDLELKTEATGVSFEPRSVEETVFLIKNLLVICRALLKWFKNPVVKINLAKEIERKSQTITVRSHTGDLIEQFTF